MPLFSDISDVEDSIVNDQTVHDSGGSADKRPREEAAEASMIAWIFDNFPLAKERNIDSGDSLLDSGVIDSLGTLELVAYLEREFDFIVEDEDMVADHFETIASITAFVKTKLEN